MKKLLTILITLLLTAQLCAQNLEFNRVVLVSSTDTVPTGKVWKITNVFCSMPSNAGLTDIYIKINGTPVTIHSKYVFQTSQSYTIEAEFFSAINGPFWLPENTILDVDDAKFISVIEFNTQ